MSFPGWASRRRETAAARLVLRLECLEDRRVPALAADPMNGAAGLIAGQAGSLSALSQSFAAAIPLQQAIDRQLASLGATMTAFEHGSFSSVSALQYAALFSSYLQHEQTGLSQLAVTAPSQAVAQYSSQASGQVGQESVAFQSWLSSTQPVPPQPQITLQPVSQTRVAGYAVQFTAAAIGTPTPWAHWQVSTDGGTTFSYLSNSSVVSGAYSPTLTLSHLTQAQNSSLYRAVFFNASGSVPTSAATLTMHSAPQVTTQPTSQVALVGNSVTFTTDGTGTPPPAFQWEFSTDGGRTYTNLVDGNGVSGSSSATLTLSSVTLAQNTAIYRAALYNLAGAAWTSPVSLTVQAPPQITIQPVDQTINPGDTVSFTAAASGFPAPMVQWQMSTDGIHFSSLSDGNGVSGSATPTLTLSSVSSSLDSTQYRAVFTNPAGTIMTSAASLIVEAQPTTGIYRLTTRGQPDMALDVQNFSNSDGSAVQLWWATHNSNQQWLVQAQGDGSYKIYAYSAANSLQMLDDNGGNTSNGTPVTTWEDNGTNNQLWYFVPVGHDYYRIVPRNAQGTAQTLEINGGNSAGLDSTADIWTYWGGNNQVFRLDDPGAQAILPSPKKGLAGYPNEINAIHPSWTYNWGGSEPANLPASVEFVPMAWGYYGNANNSFVNYLNSVTAQPNVHELLGFNEPDNTSQSNLSVSDALQAWQYMAATGLPLGSPAAVHADDAWMQQFMAGAAQMGLRVDFVTIHWYGGDDPNGFLNYVTYIHNLYNKPVWITEFAPADWSGNGGVTPQQAYSFMQQVIPALEAMPYVQRFSWFSPSPSDPYLGQDALFNNDGSLTPLGQLYARL